MGEYVGRIYQEVRKRPRFVIRRVLEENTDSAEEKTAQLTSLAGSGN
jgi:undecaprenyl-phosphate 4-deoxy-4-formamido-L-arabinose transferase